MSVLVGVLAARLRALMENHGHSPRSISMLRVEKTGAGSKDGWAQRRWFAPGAKGARSLDFPFIQEVCDLLGVDDDLLLHPVVDQTDLVVLRWVDARQPSQEEAVQAWPAPMIRMESVASNGHNHWYFRTSSPQRLLDQQLIRATDSGLLVLTQQGRQVLESHPPE